MEDKTINTLFDIIKSEEWTEEESKSLAYNFLNQLYDCKMVPDLLVDMAKQICIDKLEIGKLKDKGIENGKVE